MIIRFLSLNVLSFLSCRLQSFTILEDMDTLRFKIDFKVKILTCEKEVMMYANIIYCDRFQQITFFFFAYFEKDTLFVFELLTFL